MKNKKIKKINVKLLGNVFLKIYILHGVPNFAKLPVAWFSFLGIFPYFEEGTFFFVSPGYASVFYWLGNWLS